MKHLRPSHTRRKAGCPRFRPRAIHDLQSCPAHQHDPAPLRAGRRIVSDVNRRRRLAIHMQAKPQGISAKEAGLDLPMMVPRAL